MATGYRYSLVYRADDGEKLTLCQEKKTKRSNAEVTRKKFSLTQIDAFTTRLKGEEDLKKLFEHLAKRELKSGKFWVEYIQDKKRKKMRVVYKNEEILARFSNENIGNTHIETDCNFETYVQNILFTCTHEPSLYKYLIQNRYINKYVLNKIEDYLEAVKLGNEEFIKFTYRKVREALKSYKIVRNIEDGIAKYRKKGEIKYNENPFVEDEVVERGHQYKLF